MSEIHDLERDLEDKIGADRLELLNKAARTLQHTHPTKAYEYAQEALALTQPLGRAASRTDSNDFELAFSEFDNLAGSV